MSYSKSWRTSAIIGLLLVHCGGGDPAAEAVVSARNQLSSGDLPAALSTYEDAFAANPQSIDAAVGVAYGAYLRGDHDRADQVLASVEDIAPERRGEILLRRALVALADGDLDEVRSLGESSGTPAGQLMAAEVALADGERETANALLDGVKSAGAGDVSSTAAEYLKLMKDDDPRVQGVSEALALWALGKRTVAVRSVEELLKSLPDDREDKDELLLLWAGRAAAAGEPQVASNLVESIAFPPPGQQWRVIATRGLVACAEGDGEKCKRVMDGLEDKAPAAGLSDARATAAILMAEHDVDMALEIVGNNPSVATARALLAAGDTEHARQVVTSGPFSSFLASQSGG